MKHRLLIASKWLLHLITWIGALAAIGWPVWAIWFGCSILYEFPSPAAYREYTTGVVFVYLVVPFLLLMIGLGCYLSIVAFRKVYLGLRNEQLRHGRFLRGAAAVVIIVCLPVLMLDVGAIGDILEIITRTHVCSNLNLFLLVALTTPWVAIPTILYVTLSESSAPLCDH